jgi:phosphoglycerol transferase MdoB-like AlkP superfamily enzyme
MKAAFLLQGLKWMAFWLLLFGIGRIFFCAIVAAFGFYPPAGVWEAFYHALRLDISMAAYFLFLPWLIFLPLQRFRQPWIKTQLDAFFIFFLFINALVTIGEACLYTEWKSKLTAQALTYLTTPDEVAKSANTSITLTFLFCSLALFTLSVWVYLKFVRSKTIEPMPLLWFIPQWIVVAGILLIGVRGGFQTFPISRSDAVFSTNPVLNDIAVNPTWNIAKDCLEYVANNRSNPYIEMPDDQAQAIVESLFSVPKDTTLSILTQAKPNVVFIVLESWTAYASKSLGGDDFTPKFDSLASNGLLFTRCYSNGYISDQGVPAILSSQPCTRRMSLINQAQKAKKIPCINEVMAKNGYETGFLFGGDLNYGDMKSYILSKGFDVVLDEKNVPPAPNKAKLGTNDWEMAQIVNKQLAKTKTPFFEVWYTLSSHSPFDIPEPMVPLTKVENPYVNSIRFSDKALGRFFDLAKSQAWYRNTLFVIISDHSHYNHREIEPQNMEYHRIPLLMFGEVLKPEFKGKRWDKVVSQLDVTPTVLSQLGFDKSAFKWGKNSFNPYTKPSAFFTLHFGSGLVEEEGYVSFAKEYAWHMATDIKEQSRQDTVAKHGKAMQQRVYDDYLKR